MARLSQKYRVGARIGGGGMAEVMRATSVGAEGFARPVAIKRVRADLSADPAFGHMFINEARLASLLHHPNIASVLDFDRDDDGSYFLVMELVDGLDLRALTQSGPIPPHVAAHIVGEILQGLSYAHELSADGKHLGIVHRDVSPHNVMVSWGGNVKLVDFGIAKAVRSTNASAPGTVKGKVSYMSPEQARGEPLDHRSDLFAVGIIFHELLTGQRLFTGDHSAEVLSRVLHRPIPSAEQLRQGVPADLAAIASTLLARKRSHRFQSARAALEALLRCPSMTARGGLDLQELLRTRFPDRAPRIPTAVSGARPAVTAPTAPSRPQAIATPKSTLTAETGPTPTAAGQQTRTGTRAAVGRRSLMWLAGGAGFLVAAAVIVVAALATGGSGDSGPRVATAGPADAGLTVRAEAPADAAMVAAASAVDAGVTDAAQAARRVERKREKKRREPPAPAPAPAGDPGTLRITVAPWAFVTVDGQDRGTTPVTVKLTPGDHEIIIRNPELDRTETIRKTIEPGERTSIRRAW